MTTNGLPQSAPDTVSRYRAAESLLDAETETTVRQLIGAKKNNEVRTGTPPAGAIDGVEISSAHQTHFARKAEALNFIRA
jgi:hypothetical protein